MADLLLLLASGYAGFWSFKKLRLPSPPILGPLFFTAVLNLSGLVSFSGLPGNLSMLFTIGVAISVCQDFVFTGKEGWLELGVVIVYTFLIGLAAFGILAASGMDKATALFSSVPGGGTDLALIALGFEGADSFRIVLYQTIRFFLVVLCYPVLIPRLALLSERLRRKKAGRCGAFSAPPAAASAGAPAAPLEAVRLEDEEDGVAIEADPSKSGKGPALKYRALPAYANTSLMIAIYILGLFLALLFNRLRINGGTYLGGMAATMLSSGALRRRFRVKPAMGRKAATFFKIGAMSLLGLSITWDSLVAMGREWPVVLGTSGFILLSGVILGWIFYRLNRFDLVTSLLVTAPGGVLPMSIMAEEMGADVVKVSIFQVVRIIALVLLAPVVGNFLLS